MNHKTYFFHVLTAALAATLLATGIAQFIDLPIVYRDSITRECVRVDSVSGNINCSTLQKKYNTVLIGGDHRSGGDL